MMNEIPYTVYRVGYYPRKQLVSPYEPVSVDELVEVLVVAWDIAELKEVFDRRYNEDYADQIAIQEVEVLGKSYLPNGINDVKEGDEKE